MISDIEPNWEREKPNRIWDPSRKLLKTIRDYQRYSHCSGVTIKILRILCVLRHRFWSTVTGADIPLNCLIGGGLLIPHPNGIVIHPLAKIGVNCLVHQQVTIGVKRGEETAPIIGGHVDIGAGAKIIGNIKIGAHAEVGANAVVTKDVMPYDVVAGIPAKKIGSSKYLNGPH